MRAFGSMTFTFTGTENLYISQVQVTCLPASNRPLPLLNQNLDVMAGFTNASNTSATGLRMSISALQLVSWLQDAVRDARFQRAFSAMRALTNFFTNVMGKGFSGVKRIVPLLASKPFKAF